MSKMIISHSEQNWKNVIQKQPFADVLQNRCSKNVAKFTGKPVFESLFKKVAGLRVLQHYQKETSTQVFSCQICERTTFFCRTPPVAASGDNKSHTRLFTQRKQTFSSQSTRHFSETAYYLRF